jgi:DNA-binding NarL/FixJ family response regulator
LFLEALQKNIDGYILKMADVEELKEAIVRIHKGDYYFDREITEELIMSETISDKYSKEIDDLTEREREIMLFIAQGMSSAEIGERLKISAHTIYNHRRSIFKKLDCKNSAEIVNIAIKSGLYRV